MKLRTLIAAATLLLLPMALAAQAPIASFYNTYHPAVPGAGMAVQCGGAQSGIRGEYVCSMIELSGEITVRYQDASSTAQTLTFTDGAVGRDGVVTGGSVSGTDLTLTRSEGGSVMISGLPSGGGGGLDEAAVDARVNTVAADACVDIAYAGSTLTCTQLDGGTDAVTITTTGTTDGVVTAGAVSDTTLTLTRSEGAPVVITGLPSGGGASLQDVLNAVLQGDNVMVDRTVAGQITVSVDDGSVGTADILVDELGAMTTLFTLDPSGIWVGTGITIPATTHAILVDLSPATDDYHFVDWDTIRAKAAGTIGEVSIPAQYETFVAQTTTGVGHLVRIGHDNAGQVLLADHGGTGINIESLRIERILVPVVPGTNDGVVTAGSVSDTADLVLTRSQGNPVTITGFGTAALADTGAADGNVPVLGASGDLADDVIPDGIARDSEIPALDGVLDSAMFSGTTLTLGLTVGENVVVSGIGGAAGTFDGVVSGITFGMGAASHSMTLTRTEGLDALTTTLPFEVVEPATDGTLRAATEADLGRIARDHLNLRVATRQLLDITGRVVTTAHYAAAGYIGTETSCYNTGVTTLGSTCYNRINHNWYIRVASGWTNTGATPAGWIGIQASRAEAEEAVTAVGQIFYITGLAFVDQVTAFMAPVANYEYHWEPEQERQALLARPVLPVPSMDVVHEYVRVNAAGTAYENHTIEEEVEVVTPAELGGSGDVINFSDSVVPPIDGRLYVWITKYPNTGPTTITRDSETYGLVKVAENGGIEAMEGGELVLDHPVIALYHGSTYYWIGTLLGSAAKRDVGADPGELVSVGADGLLPFVTDPSVRYTNTPGFPGGVPRAPGHLASDDHGNLYVGRNEVIVPSNVPTFSPAGVDITNGLWARYHGVNPLATPTTFGDFWFATNLSHWQWHDSIQQTDSYRSGSWSDLVQFYRDNTALLAGAPVNAIQSTGGTASRFFTGPYVAFASQDDAALSLANSLPATDQPTLFFVGDRHDSSTWLFYVVAFGTWNAGTTTEITELHWSGPIGPDEVATTTKRGIVRLSTDAEAIAGSSTDSVVTAAQLPLFSFVQPYEDTGPPVDEPVRHGEIGISERGDAYVAGARRIQHHTPASFAVVQQLDVNDATWPNWRGVHFANEDYPSPGDFIYHEAGRSWAWRAPGNVTHAGTWSQLYDFIRATPAYLLNAPTDLFGPTRSVRVLCGSLTGACASDEEAAQQIASNLARDATYDTNRVFVWIDEAGLVYSEWTIRYAAAGQWQAGTSTVLEDPYWRHRLVAEDDECLIPDGGDVHDVLARTSSGRDCVTEWSSRVAYRGDVADGTDFQQGDIFHQNGHYYLRVAADGAQTPLQSPTSWIRFSDQVQADSGCGTVVHQIELPNDNRLLSILGVGVATIDVTDSPIWEITYTPISANSHVVVFSNVQLQAVDDADTEGVTRYIYGIYRQSGSGTDQAFGGVGSGELAHHDDEGVAEYDHLLSYWYNDRPNTTDPVTYKLRIQRRTARNDGASMEIQMAGYQVSVVDFGDPAESCDLRTVIETVPAAKDGIEVVGEPTTYNFIGQSVTVADNNGVADITIDPFAAPVGADLSALDVFLVRDADGATGGAARDETITYPALRDAISPDIFAGTSRISFGPPSITFGTGLVATADADTNAVTVIATGGGGTGTDDQTAAEVTYSSDAAGNIPEAAATVQAALDALDDLTITGGGGGVVIKEASTSPNPTAATVVNFTDLDFIVGNVNEGTATVALQGYLPLLSGTTGHVWTKTATGGAWDAAGSGAAFDLYPDVTQQAQAPLNLGSRFVVGSNEVGNPNRYIRFDALVDDIREQLPHNTSPSNPDRIPITNEDVQNAPFQYITYEELRAGLGGGGGSDGALTATTITATDTTRALTYTITGGSSFSGALPMPWAGATVLSSLDGGQRILLWDQDQNPDELNFMTTTAFASALSLGAAPYNDARYYFAGTLVETGSGVNAAFWIAPADIANGQGAPTLEHPGSWFEVAVAGGWRGELDLTDTYDLHEGDFYHIGDRVFAVTADTDNVTGADLRSADHIIEIGNPEPFDNTASYIQGIFTETGTGLDTVLWVAPLDISPGEGAPTLEHPLNWLEVAARGGWRGEFDITDTYDVHEGDTYHIGDRVFFVTEDMDDLTGVDLTSAAHIIELGNVGDVLFDALDGDGTQDYPSAVPALADTLPLRDTDATTMRRTTVDDLREGLGLDNAYVSHSITGSTVTFTEADGGTADLVLPTGGGGGTTVSANPGGADLAELNSIGIGDTNWRIAHPHRGTYEADRAYVQGDIIEVGTDTDAQFWIAREDISVGQGAPSQADLGSWWLAAGHGWYRGDLLDATSYDVFPGDIYYAGTEYWIAVAQLTDRTGLELAGRTDGMDRMINEIQVMRNGQSVPNPNDHADIIDHLDAINFTGNAVTVAWGDGYDALGDVAVVTINGDGTGTDDQTAAEVTVTATGFDGNLATTDTNLQLVTQKVDDLVLGGGGGDPSQIGSDFIDAAITANTWTVTGITIPSTGWLRVIGVCDKSAPSNRGDFSYYAPRERFTELGASTVSESVLLPNRALVFAPDTFDQVFIGRTSADQLLMSCEQAGIAELRAYDR